MNRLYDAPIQKLLYFWLIILLLGACTLADKETSPAYATTFEPADCQFSFSGGGDYDCGYLVVPEDRSEPTGRTIRLHVARFHSTGDTPKSDPIIYLQGGPGNPVLQWAEHYHELFRIIQKDRDVIFFDQRGVGYSEPSLDCPEFEEAFPKSFGANVGLEEAFALRLDSLQTCRERLIEEGVNLSAYNSEANAADVHDLMQALGHDQYNLYGVSYGTRLALTVMRDYPQEIRSAVLDSVVPTDVDMFETFTSSAQRSFNVLFERCAADDACNQEYPNLENLFYTLAEQLEQEPMQVGWAGVRYQIGGDELIQVAFAAMYNPTWIERLPREINRVAEGQSGLLLTSGLGNYFSTWTDSLSEGMHFSVWCTEEIPFNSVEDAAELNADVHPAVLQGMKSEDWLINAPACEVWDVVAADAIEDEPVQSEIPTLILAGEYDPVTPPAFGSRVAETLTNSQLIVAKDHSHGVFFSSSCVRQITAQFIDAPEEIADSSCLETTDQD